MRIERNLIDKYPTRDEKLYNIYLKSTVMLLLVFWRHGHRPSCGKTLGTITEEHFEVW